MLPHTADKSLVAKTVLITKLNNVRYQQISWVVAGGYISL